MHLEQKAQMHLTPLVARISAERKHIVKMFAAASAAKLHPVLQYHFDENGKKEKGTIPIYLATETVDHQNETLSLCSRAPLPYE